MPGSGGTITGPDGIPRQVRRRDPWLDQLLDGLNQPKQPPTQAGGELLDGLDQTLGRSASPWMQEVDTGSTWNADVNLQEQANRQGDAMLGQALGGQFQADRLGDYFKWNYGLPGQEKQMYAPGVQDPAKMAWNPYAHNPVDWLSEPDKRRWETDRIGMQRAARRANLSLEQKRKLQELGFL